MVVETSMTTPAFPSGAVFPPTPSAFASESYADEDRFVDQGHAERRAHAVAYLAGQLQKIFGAGAVRVGERERVLGRDADRAAGVALDEARLVDQPRGR